jgi:hypothetical protein
MTSNSKGKAQQNVQMIVELLQQRVVDHLKAHGPQPWDTLVVELNQSKLAISTPLSKNCSNGKPSS